MWISIKEKLPKEGQSVLIYVPNSPWLYGDETEKIGIATRKVGISKQDREEMPHDASGRKVAFLSEDEDGNNLKPYCWKSFGQTIYGQAVTHWMELPGDPEVEEKFKPKYCFLTDWRKTWQGQYETIEEAERKAKLLVCTPGEGYMIAECCPVDESDFVPDAVNIIEQMADLAWDNFGEWSENWLSNVKDDEKNELHDLIHNAINKWFTKYSGHKPSFFNVGQIVKDVKPEDKNNPF